MMLHVADVAFCLLFVVSVSCARLHQPDNFMLSYRFSFSWTSSAFLIIESCGWQSSSRLARANWKNHNSAYDVITNTDSVHCLAPISFLPCAANLSLHSGSCWGTCCPRVDWHHKYTHCLVLNFMHQISKKWACSTMYNGVGWKFDRQLRTKWCIKKCTSSQPTAWKSITAIIEAATTRI